MSSPRATLSQAHDSNVWSLAYHPFGHILVSASNDHTTRFWSRERPGDASSVFSGGGEKPPDIIDTSGQDEDDDALVPGFVYGGGGGGGGWGGKDEDGGGALNEGSGGGHLAEYPDDDFIPGFGASASSDAASRLNGHTSSPSQQQQDNMYGDDWGHGGAHRSARFGPRRGGRY